MFKTTTNKVKDVTCKVCRRHCHRIETLYRGKIVQDVNRYGQNGTSYIFKPNLERHMSSAGHIKCLEIETGEPVCKKQKTLSSAFGSARERSLKALQSAMRCSLFIGRKEKPFTEFRDLLELNCENGCTVSSSFNNPRVCKVFNHYIAQNMVDETVKTIKDGSFYSWLIDGSSVSKNKLTYEAELLFIRTAPELVPRTSLFNLISMNDYGRVTSDHLFHTVLSNLARITSEGLKLQGNQNIVDIPVDTLIKQIKNTSVNQCIGAGADGASINFGVKKGLTVQFKESIAPWCVSIHCFAHRLELSCGDSIKKSFADVITFNTEMYQHFKNSPTEWMLLNKLGNEMQIIVMRIPKPYGTRFVSHLIKCIRFNWMLLSLHFMNTKEENQNKDQTAKAVSYLEFVKF